MHNKPSLRGPIYAREKGPDFLARISFIPGRRGYYQSDSQFTFHFKDCDLTKYMHFEFVDRLQAFPGDDVSALFWFMRPEMNYGRMHPGIEFEIEPG